MTTQTIPQYLEEERQKATENQLRTEEQAARIQPLQHGHHRTAKPSKLELLPPFKASTKKKKTTTKTKTKTKTKKTSTVARNKPRAGGTKAAKIRKKA